MSLKISYFRIVTPLCLCCATITWNACSTLETPATPDGNSKTSEVAVVSPKDQSLTVDQEIAALPTAPEPTRANLPIAEASSKPVENLHDENKPEPSSCEKEKCIESNKSSLISNSEPKPSASPNMVKLTETMKEAEKAANLTTQVVEKAIEDSKIAAEQSAKDSDFDNAKGLKTIHFPFDSYTLTEAAQNNLNSNADILKKVESIVVRIGGHADKYGSAKYNRKLGLSRATTVKVYLLGLGIKSSRINMVSYGKSHPLKENENHPKRNRRVNFVIISE